MSRIRGIAAVVTLLAAACSGPSADKASQDPAPTTEPSATSSPTANVTIPKLVGMKLSAAQQVADVKGVQLQVGREPSMQPEDTVIKQFPRPGAEVESSVVQVVVATRPPKVPHLVGKKLDAARHLLDQLGLRLKVAGHTSSSRPRNTILWQSPGPGKRLTPSKPVRVRIAVPPPKPPPPPHEGDPCVPGQPLPPGWICTTT